MRFFLAIILSLGALIADANRTSLTDGVPEDPFFMFVSYSGEESLEFKLSVKEEIDQFIERVKNHRNFGANSFTVKKVYYSLHRRYLKKYNQYSKFEQLFKDGKYDCLTATALYAYVFDAFGFEYRIAQTDYHVFLAVKLSNDETVLIEPTDPLNGIVTGSAIQDRLATYISDSPGNIETVKLNEITGLLHFNEAVRYFNNKEFINSFELLEIGFDYFQNKKMEELLYLSFSNIIRSTLLTENQKDDYRIRFFNLISEKPIASN